MIDMLKRHEIQVLRRADHTWSEIAALSGVSEKTARRIAAEDPVTAVDNTAERARRQVGRPSKAEVYRDVLVQALTENPELRSVELLHRARQAGYAGGKSALYTLAQTLRVRTVTPLVRFEGLPGEFSQMSDSFLTRAEVPDEMSILLGRNRCRRPALSALSQGFRQTSWCSAVAYRLAEAVSVRPVGADDGTRDQRVGTLDRRTNELRSH
jgi:hypothetical protein